MGVDPHFEANPVLLTMILGSSFAPPEQVKRSNYISAIFSNSHTRSPHSNLNECEQQSLFINRRI